VFATAMKICACSGNTRPKSGAGRRGSGFIGHRRRSLVCLQLNLFIGDPQSCHDVGA
jgi:hypothetical protein